MSLYPISKTIYISKIYGLRCCLPGCSGTSEWPFYQNPRDSGACVCWYTRCLIDGLGTNQLTGYNIKPEDLKITPGTLKFFNRGVGIGVAMAHYRHTTNGNVTMQEFALKNLE